MSTIAWLNDTPLEDLGLGPRSANWWDSVVFERATIPLVDQFGQVASNVGTGAPRELQIECLLEATSVSDRRDKLDAIMRLIGYGPVELRVQDDEDRVLLARLVNYTAAQFSDNPYGGQPYLDVTLELVADDPTFYDRYARAVGLSTSAAEVAVGTLPNYGVLYLQGASDPTVTYKAHSGETVATLELAYTWASGDVYRVDLGLQTIDKIASGTRTNGISVYSTGDFFSLDPRDGDAAATDWPTITLSTGSGVIYYQRRWS